MPTTTNYGFPTPSSGDDPDVPADMLALAQDIDTELKNTISTKWITSNGLHGTYAGQQVKIWTMQGAFSTDANGDTIVLANAEFVSGGILFAGGHGTSTFQISAAFRIQTGNLVARVWSGAALAASTSVSMNFIVVGW